MANYAELTPNYKVAIGNSFSPFDRFGNDLEELPAFKLWQDKNGNPNNDTFGAYYCDNSALAMRGVGYETAVSKMYFSRENMRRIQQKIKTAVYRQSKGKFRLDVDQDENDLYLAMRAIYLDNAKNLPHHIVKQVKALNEFVIEFIVPDIMTNIKQQYDYIRDITLPIRPLPQPLNVGRAGRKALPSVTTIWAFNR